MQIPKSAMNPIPAEMEKLNPVINKAPIPQLLHKEHSIKPDQHLLNFQKEQTE